MTRQRGSRATSTSDLTAPLCKTRGLPLVAFVFTTTASALARPTVATVTLAFPLVNLAGLSVAVFVFNNSVQAQLAAIIDLSNLNLNLLSDLQDVFNVLNTLAANQATDLRDV